MRRLRISVSGFGLRNADENRKIGQARATVLRHTVCMSEGRRPATAADYHERILRVLVHIQSHLDDAICIDDLARIACFSPFHFHHVFSGMVGEGVMEHIRRLRLERAAARLTDRQCCRGHRVRGGL